MKTIITFLISASLAFAALPATGVIEIRSTATAGNVNGGGFNAARGGTDYTLQDAAQLTATDGASTTTSTTFTSASRTFTSVMVGNYIHITTTGTGAQCVIGWYEVVTYTDANNVVLDRAPSAGTGCVAATWYLGGAMSMGSTLDDDLFEIAVAGNTFYVKNGAYTTGETISISAAGTAALPIFIIGYNSTRGDNPTGNTRPSISLSASSFTTGEYWRVFYASVTGTNATMFTAGGENIFAWSKFVNNSTTATRTAVYSNSVDLLLLSVEAISYRGVAVSFTARGAIIGSYIHDSDIGIMLSGASSPLSIMNSVISGNVTYGLQTATTAPGSTLLIANCTLYGSGNTTGTGVNLITSTANVRLINSIISGFAVGVAHASATNDGYDNWNAYYNNDADVSNWVKGAGDITTDPTFAGVAQLTGTTATTSGSVLTQSGGDFSSVTDNVDFIYLVSGTGVTAGKYLIASHTADTVTLDIAPGTNATADKVWQITAGHNFAVGANMKALAAPGAFPGGLTTGYLDIGAVQRVEPAASAASGGSYVFVQ